LAGYVKDHRDELKKYKPVGTSSTPGLLNSILEIGVEPSGHGPPRGNILLTAKIFNG
jgi:methylglyoxal synthase